MRTITFCLMFLFQLAFLGGVEDLQIPTNSFAIKGRLIGGERQIYYFNEKKDKVQVGSLDVYKINDLTVCDLYNVKGLFLAQMQEQYHTRNRGFTYDRIFILKDRQNNPIGELIVHYTLFSCGYEFFESDGTLLFHCKDLVDNSHTDYFMKDRIATSKLKDYYTRKVKILNPEFFTENDQHWLEFVMIKSMFWRVTDVLRNE